MRDRFTYVGRNRKPVWKRVYLTYDGVKKMYRPFYVLGIILRYYY